MKKNKVIWEHKKPDYDLFHIGEEMFFFKPEDFDEILQIIDKTSIYSSFFISTEKEFKK